MATEPFQRTLLLGLGQVGAKTAELLLARLRDRLGPVEIIRGLALTTEEPPPAQLVDCLRLSPEAGFEAWQPEVEQRVAQALRAMSRLDELGKLARQGLRLDQTDEIHIVVIANPAEVWIGRCLQPLIGGLRRVVERTLACYAGLTGLFLLVEPAEPGPDPSGGWPGDSLPVDEFERGCFVAGLINELGLIIGEADDLIGQASYFLTLLLDASLEPGLTEHPLELAGWGRPLTSFGVARLRWPGSDLIGPLSMGWSQALLAALTRPPGGGAIPALARQAGQQWFGGEKLAPPLLLDRITALMPPLPAPMAAPAPDPAWPWELKEVQAELEKAARQWQDNCLAGRPALHSVLAELKQSWPEQVEGWLKQQLAGVTTGFVPLALSYLAAVTELLLAFVEGVEQSLAEAEADLAQAERRLGAAAEALAREWAALPESPLRLALGLGLRPWRWLWLWRQCRQIQALLRNFAHLSRARLAAWQRLSYYEEILPFYRQLLADWGQLSPGWEQACRQVVEAGRLAAGIDWRGQIKERLQAAGGPWDEAPVLTLYDEAVKLHEAAVWEQVGPPLTWLASGLAAEAIFQRLCSQTGQALSSALLLPVDQALAWQLPKEADLAAWLAALAEQARPFWRYDETSLAEISRSQSRLERWLLLPGGEASPLAGAGRKWSPPPAVRASPRPEDLALVTIRQVYQVKINDEE